MSIQAPQGILNIPNATLRVGKLAVDSTAGFDTLFNNVERNTILLEDSTEYTETKQWDLKMPNIFVATFEIEGAGSSFNFRNTSNGDATKGYTLTFSGTTLTLKYNDSQLGVPTTIPNLDSNYGKVYLTYEKQHFTVTVDGTLVLTYKDTGTRTFPDGEYANFFKGTGGGFKNLKVVAGHFISDGTSNVSLFGGLAVTSNLEVGSSNLFVDTQTSRVGLGTSTPGATLDVSGNVYVSSNLEVGSSNLFVDTQTSRVGVGTNTPKEALDVVGNMHLTRVSNVSQIKVDSNVVTEYTGPHDRPLRKYPEVELDVNAMTSPGVGGYIVTQSGQYSGAFAGWTVFGEEFTTTNAEGSGGAWIDGSPGSYAKEAGETPNGVVGSVLTTVQNAGTLKLASNTPVGAWVSLELPTSIKLQRIEMRPRLQHLSETDLNEVALQSFPREFGIWGYDGSNWVLLKSVTGHSAGSAFGYTPTHVNATTAYNKYAIVVTRTNAVGGSNSDDRNFTAIGQLYFYGYEEGSGSLDTTLKSVYNVPATTGTQLEVYYDAKDLTTMPSTLTDLAGGDQNGAVTGVTLDTTGGIKSFLFDSSSEYISGTLPSTATGNWVHTISTWVNLPQIPTSGNYLFNAGIQPSSSSPGESLVIYIRQAGVYFDVGYESYRVDTLTPGQWSHISAVYTGGTLTSGVSIYINGVLKSQTDTSGSTQLNLTTQDFKIGASANGGSQFNGSIANFRLYSKALNADQVKELYDYQKDYFLGSKSQVTLYKGHLGVGVTEPSGQLELAGDERIQEYPPRALTGYSTHIEGHGVFEVEGDTFYTPTNPDLDPWKAFNDDNTLNFGRWRQASNQFTAGSASSSGGPVDSRAYASGLPNASWLVLHLPYDVNLKGYSICPQGGQSPGNIQIWGSSDGGTSWSHLHSQTQTNGDNTAYQNYTITHEGHYSIIAYLILTLAPSTQTYPTATEVSIRDMKYFGTPGPTTLDKGSLTLGRSLDVPRISRYDVDTETPRPEKLVVDFDTTVNSTPTDISGKGNHGAFYGVSSYSPADKAFSLSDGTTAGQIATRPITVPAGAGVFIHSISFWGWVSEWNVPFFYMDDTYPAGGVTNTTAHCVLDSAGLLRYDFWSNAIQVQNGNTFPKRQWVHVGLVYKGGAVTSTSVEIYYNGVKQAVNTASNAAYTSPSSVYLQLGSTNTLHIKISNFKLYNVALEPSEVKKLYNLGRTGRSMVISDTAVGIGKVPEAQLDVRGVANFGSRVGIGTTNPITNLHINHDLHIQANDAAWNETAGKGLYLRYSTVSGQDQAYIQSIDRSNTSDTYPMYFEASSFIFNNGDVGIGTTDPDYTLDINGTIRYTSAGSSASDDRIKYNEQNVSNALTLISQLNPQKYEKIMERPNPCEGTWIPTDEEWENVKEDYTYGDEFGFIAQDVRAVPELAFLVHGEETRSDTKTSSPEEYSNLTTEEQLTYTTSYTYESNTITQEEYSNLSPEEQGLYSTQYTKQIETQTPLALNYQGLFVVAIGAIKELKAKNDDLEARITALENA
jgi:hypothetical protein